MICHPLGLEVIDMPRLLLTGGQGMVGQNIRAHHQAKSWEILAPTSTELNLRDENLVRAYIKAKRPDVVIHAAGRVGGIQANMAHPVEFLDANNVIGRNVIMSAWAEGVRDLINLGSTCMYPAAALNPLSEDMILTGPLEPTNEGYALAKIMAMRLCNYINREDAGARFKTLIPCNLFGPHDKFDPKHSHLLPAIIHKVHQAKIDKQPTVEIWGDGTARREFMYAPDLADAVWCAVTDIEALPELINIGLGQDHTINNYYAEVAHVIGWTGDFVHDLTRPVGMKQKLCDTSRAQEWGWRAPTSLRTGIEETYKFYSERYIG
jgi:GDP-L-fucose synthase